MTDLKRLRKVMEEEMVKEGEAVKEKSKKVVSEIHPGKQFHPPRNHKAKPAAGKPKHTSSPVSASGDTANTEVPADAEDSPSPRGTANGSPKEAADKKSTTPVGAAEGAEAKPPTKKKKSKKKAKIPNIETVTASKLSLVPVDKPQPPVPRLAYGLDRVLFNPGVYHLQDPRSRVYNFDPYLAGIMPVKEFDFGALRQYVTSSKDMTLANIAKEAGKKYSGSTSSMTSMLAHFHYLLSAWRPINPDHVSRSFPVESRNFTRIGRAPAAIFLQYQDGTYAIDADKEFDTANVLSMLGKSMEKLLTLPKEDFEKYRRINSDQLTEEERNSDESYHYTTMGDFMMRSQLDAHDPRVPGTGMFDLKTRAVVSIRMDAQAYHKGVGYEIRHRFGEWESYEREYYDMIRSAFMKYSLQVRMGRMDGIFVAFHNIQRIFGFQYISLPEMDQSIHGTSNVTLGNSEFKLSLHLLNKLLDKATERYPKQSLRLHFETRPTDPPFMYVFAKPVTQEQIEEVQNKNKAAVEAFERDMMGLVRDEKDDAEEETPLLQEEDQSAEEDEETSLDVWEDMRLKVEEALENDEQGENFVRDAIEEALEASGLLKTESVELKQRYLEALMEAIVSEDEAETSEPSGDANVTAGEMSIGGEGEGATETVNDAPVQAEPVGEVLEEADRRSPDVQEAEQEIAGQELVEGEVESEAMPQELDTAPEPDTPAEQDTASEQLPLKDLIMRLAAKSRAGSAVYKETKDGLEEDDSSDWQKLRKFEEILREIVEKTPKATDSSAVEEASPSEATEQGNEPVPSSTETPASDQETAKEADAAASDAVDSIHQGDDILGMIVTMRNKVDGKFVERPEDLKKTSTWEVHYTIEELAKDRASNIYRQTIERRRKMLERSEDVSKWNRGFKQKLETLSKGGRAWRRKEMEKSRSKPVYVYGVDRQLKWEEVFSDQGDPHPPKLDEK
ncbi:mitochondrial protein Pet127-domain-containing protein [Coniochaeta sp. 2T2.1]|nr:mitochondrial protein Pet127-domain-containing protein [Coniochaeta sp. 2T2.1]